MAKHLTLISVLMISSVIAFGQAYRKKQPPLPDPFDGQYPGPRKPLPVDLLPSIVREKIKKWKKKVKAATNGHLRGSPPPELLKKLERVNDMSDFLREFNVRNVQQKFVAGRSSGNYLTIRNNHYSVKLASDGHVMNNKHKYTTVGKVVDVSIPDSIGCEPRYTLAKIEKPEGTYMNWPSCVYAKQCGGCCVHDFKECVPTKMVTKKHTIFRVPYYNDPYPQEVDVWHHITCQCQCSVKESDCINRQVFDDANCQCTCPDAQRLQCPRGKHWSKTACACECSKKQQHCGSERQFWDADRCRCRCKPKSCPQGQVQDTHSCVCAKLSHSVKHYG